MEITSSRDDEKRPQALQQGDREWLKEETGRLRGTGTKRKKLPTASSAELLDARAQDLPAGVFRAKFDAKPPFPARRRKSTRIVFRVPAFLGPKPVFPMIAWHMEKNKNDTKSSGAG
ncbi:hypothetical protein GE21DRAFT_1304185 [Neurospora crassa]|nr:hypothetical protein GE21DRAFT_1304185 [Neurospora crassa]